MTDQLRELRMRLYDAKDDAFRVYEANKASGSPSASAAFDSGRYDGLKQATDIFDRLVAK